MGSFWSRCWPGDYFYDTTGEVLLPSVEWKAEGDTVAAQVSSSYTFPLQMAEIVWGDGAKTRRTIFPLDSTREFGAKLSTGNWRRRDGSGPAWPSGTRPATRLHQSHLEVTSVPRLSSPVHIVKRQSTIFRNKLLDTVGLSDLTDLFKKVVRLLDRWRRVWRGSA